MSSNLNRRKTSDPYLRGAVAVALAWRARAIHFVVILPTEGRRAAAPPCARAHAVVMEDNPSHARGKPVMLTHPASSTASMNSSAGFAVLSTPAVVTVDAGVQPPHAAPGPGGWGGLLMLLLTRGGRRGGPGRCCRSGDDQRHRRRDGVRRRGGGTSGAQSRGAGFHGGAKVVLVKAPQVGRTERHLRRGARRRTAAK